MSVVPRSVARMQDRRGLADVGATQVAQTYEELIQVPKSPTLPLAMFERQV